MWLLIMEAGVALFLLVFIVWWTMFLPPKERPEELDEQLPAPDPAVVSRKCDEGGGQAN